MLRHPLLRTLFSLRGDPRAVVFTEPLFNIPFQLFGPYASVYMLALGLRDEQIGLLASIGLGVQVLTSLISGPLTDKFGRKLVTLLSDLLAWGVSIVILIFAQNFYYFLAATILMAFWRIPHTSWTCLLVEDADKSQLVHIWTWVYITGQLSVFFAPIAGLLINRYTLVPTIRGIYVFAFLMMMTKFVVLYIYSTETKRGRERMEETRGKPFFSLMAGYPKVLGQMLRNPRTLVALGLLVAINIINTVNGNFWSIFVTRKLGIPEANLAIFPFVRSVVMLIGFFFVTQRFSSKRFLWPMLVGIAGYLTGLTLLVTMPEKNYVLLILTVVLDAASVTLFGPLLDSLTVISMDAQERARVMALFSTTVLLIASPFGWIAGKLSSIDRALPFYLNIALYAIAAILVITAARLNKQPAPAALPAPAAD